MSVQENNSNNILNNISRQFNGRMRDHMLQEVQKREAYLKEIENINESNIQNTLLKNKPVGGYSPQKKSFSFAKVLTAFSSFGLDYKQDVIANMQAIPADKKLIPTDEQWQSQDLFSQLNAWKIKSNEDKNFFEKDFAYKREALRKLAMQPELEDILDVMSNESIVYDSDFTYIGQPFIDDNILSDLKKPVAKNIKNSINNSFYKIYSLLNWKKSAWDDFKRFLIEGILSFEIVYDNIKKPTQIIGIVPIDPATLTKQVKDNMIQWVQFKGIQGKERILLDAQIIYIKYQDTGVVTRMSYLERLIRPFNIFRIIEQAQIIWTITNASFKTKFTIPVSGMNKARGAQTVNSAMQRYREDISFNLESGELNINGKSMMPFNKEYWMPENEAGKPEIEILGGEGPDLNDSDQLKFFRNNLYKMSKIPLTRFDVEAGSSWFGTDATNVSRDEINFARFVQRLRNTFAQIIIKPLQIQVCLDIPEINSDKRILDAITFQFNSYNQFEELMEQDLMLKRIEFINQMKDSLVDIDAEGNEVKFFASEFLVKKYLKMSDSDLKLNSKYKQEEVERMNTALKDSGVENEELYLDDSNSEILETIIKIFKEEYKKRKKKKIIPKQEPLHKDKDNKDKSIINPEKDGEIITDADNKNNEEE